MKQTLYVIGTVLIVLAGIVAAAINDYQSSMFDHQIALDWVEALNK